MRKICIINQKGGVGKTTTSVSLAAGLSRSDRKVLLVDLDPQSNLELSIKLESSWTVYDYLFEGVALSECLNEMGKNLFLVRGDQRIMRSEQQDPEKIIERLNMIEGYDYVIFDCGPSMTAINRAAMLYSNEALVPTTTDYLGFESIKKMQTYLEEFADYHDHNIKLTKVVPTFFDKRNRICIEMLDKINNEYYQQVASPVRINSKLKEAPMKKMSIFRYEPKSNGAKDYWALVQSVICDEKKQADFANVSSQTRPQLAVEEEEE